MKCRPIALGVLLISIVGCGGGSSGELFQSGGAAGSSGATASGGSAGSAGGGGLAAGGSAGSAGMGGTGGMGTGGMGTGGMGTGGMGTGGTGGTPPTCPGTAPGCVIDWAGQFNSPGSMNGVGTAARFDALGNITGDGTSIYVTADSAVRRIDIATGTVSLLAGQPGNPGFANGAGPSAQFQFVDGIATDGATVWVVDGGNNVIRAIDLASGMVTTLSGAVGQSGRNDGMASSARFESPRGMTFDGTSLFVTEAAQVNSVRRINPNNGRVVTVAGNNGNGASNGSGAVAQFNRPRNLGNANGLLFVADTENHLIRQITLGMGGPATNTVSTVAGSGGGHQDGTGPAAQFNRHRGIDFDGQLLVVADSDNFVIRTVDPNTFATATIAGTPGNGTHAEGIGAAAGFDKPVDVHYDASTGDLFIIEDTVIRRMFYK